MAATRVTVVWLNVDHQRNLVDNRFKLRSTRTGDLYINPIYSHSGVSLCRVMYRFQTYVSTSPQVVWRTLGHDKAYTIGAVRFTCLAEAAEALDRRFA